MAQRITENRTEHTRGALVSILGTMMRIRAFELKVEELFLAAISPAPCTSTSARRRWRPGSAPPFDRTTTSPAPTGATATPSPRARDMDRMMAELFGKATGYCKGKGGSMHIATSPLGILGPTPSWRAGCPSPWAAALSAQDAGQRPGGGLLLRRRRHQPGHLPRVPEPGLRLEAAGGLRLREQPVRLHHPGQLRGLRQEHGAPRGGLRHAGATVDGNDVLAVRQAALAAVERARAGDGPTLLECKTYRWKGHYIGDPEQYRNKEEVARGRSAAPSSSSRATCWTGADPAGGDR